MQSTSFQQVQTTACTVWERSHNIIDPCRDLEPCIHREPEPEPEPEWPQHVAKDIWG